MSVGAPEGPGPSVLHLEAENRLEEIERVLDALEAFWKERDLDADVRRRVKLVLDEVLNNVISYAYENDGMHVIEVDVELSASRVVLRIADDGRPFNPLLHRPPDVSRGIEEREIGGLGIHLLENLMDEVSYARQGDRNVLVITKNLPAAGFAAGREKP